MAVGNGVTSANNPNTGAVSDGDQVFKGCKTLEVPNIVNSGVASGTNTISTGVGSIKMSTGNSAQNTVWIPIQHNGNIYYVPGFLAYNP